MGEVKSIFGNQSTKYEMLEGMVRGKIQGYLQDILEEEVETFLGRKKSERKKNKVDGVKGYRNGHGKMRKISLMSGTISIQRPRVRNTEERFYSKVLPLFKRRSCEVGNLIPELYLHGLAKKDFELALRGLLGDGAPLSPASIQRLKAKWELEYEGWQKRDLSHVKIAYQWADGLYVKAGLEKDKAALLVIIGASTDGEKEFLAIESGYRESKESWAALLRDLKNRGLQWGKLTVADGHLGLWAALSELYPSGDEQRCWNHKITNVLDVLPKSQRAKASEMLCKIPYAQTKDECEKMRDQFIREYKQHYPKATEKLISDWDRMVTFYSYPREHWIHLRTTNIVESPFHVVRLRTNAAKRYKKVQSATAMIFKLLMVAQKQFRRLKGYELLEDVYQGRKCIDGIFAQEINQNREAA